MAKWIPAYPVDFTPEGDRTNQAIQKHITEIARIYDMIHVLRQNFVGAGFPSSPERNQLFINPNTLEAFTYVGLSGDDDWRTIVTQSKKHTLDNHFSGTMTDLQQLVTDAFLLFLSSVPAPADNGKDISINASGSVVMSNANKLHRDNADIHTTSAEKTANANHLADWTIHTDSATKTANANHLADGDIHTTAEAKTANANHIADGTIHTDSATKTANANHIADGTIHTDSATKTANANHIADGTIHTDSATKTANANHIADGDIHVTSEIKTANANHLADTDIHTTSTEKTANANHRGDSDIHTTSTEKTANANHRNNSDIHTTSAEKTANANHRNNSDIHVTTTDKLHWNVLSGATASRPSSGNWTGRQYFDTTLGKPVWWNGTKWVLSDGSDA